MPSPVRSVDDAIPRSLWLDRLEERPARPALDGDTQVDVAIVGGGFSGLWTAYYLSLCDPSLRVAVVERHVCGFGASGRNGGWAVGELAGSTTKYAALGSMDAALRLERAAFDAVDEIGRVAAAEGIDCGYAKGGNIRLARTQPQADRQRVEVETARAHGFTEDEIRLLGPDDARAHLHAPDVRSGIFFAPCASLDPGRLVRGLADVVEGRGVAVYEQTTVESIGDREVVTDRGTVRADVTVTATEAYTRDLAGERRRLLPVYSLMVATEPLPAEIVARIGLDGRPTFGDDRRIVVYGQRTEDDRIAFGSQGVPYLFGSRIDPSTEEHLDSHRAIHDTLVELIPELRDVAVTHRWGGVLGIPRNWVPSVRFDRSTGAASLGGYVGEGVAASNLAGRTLAELIVGADTERTTLPWVDAVSRRWEPEPLRWMGVRASRAILGSADRREHRTDRPDRFATWLAGALRGD